MPYFVVVDLEMCKVPKSYKNEYNYGAEIIQIGAALMDEDYEVLGTFSTFVKPEFGYIDGFIKKLTGITVADIKDAPGIEEAIKSFLAWLPENEQVTAISWSTTDKYQIIRETQCKNIKIDARLQEMLESWIDCQPEFSEKMQMKKSYPLEEALIATDIITEGKAHNGLDDAYNTALLYAKMKKEDELVLNPLYLKAHDDSESEHLSYRLADILASAGF